MTPEERQMLAGLFERINANGAAPRDAQAEAFINDALRAAPYAPYLLAQAVLVQQHALDAAAHRVAELEAAAHEAGQQPPEQGSFLGNLGRSIFGGGAPSAPPPRGGYDPNAYRPEAAPQPASPPPPPSQYAPPRPGPWGGAPTTGGGGGFFQNAASTAAGVAGGVALGNLLGGLFGGHSGGSLFGSGSTGAGFSGGGAPAETINNFYEAAPDGSDQLQPSAPDDAGYIDDASFDDGSGGGGFDDV
jgi:uncharacterized protein